MKVLLYAQLCSIFWIEAKHNKYANGTMQIVMLSCVCHVRTFPYSQLYLIIEELLCLITFGYSTYWKHGKANIVCLHTLIMHIRLHVPLK